ncbi:MAG: GNAT family N-acetyltransferase [Rhizobiaceae bacterium]
MSETEYQRQWQRQLARNDVPDKHLPVYRWYLRHDDPGSVEPATPPREGLKIMRAVNPPISFYRYLYHTAGEEYLWGDRRRMGDEELAPLISPDHIHLMVLYSDGAPAGFYELSTHRETESHVKYFALLPDFKGGGLGSYMLNAAIVQAGERGLPVVLDTCTLDHPIALENYKARGFVVMHGEDETYLDPRLDGTVSPESGKHIPIPV